MNNNIDYVNNVNNRRNSRAKFLYIVLTSLLGGFCAICGYVYSQRQEDLPRILAIVLLISLVEMLFVRITWSLFESAQVTIVIEKSDFEELRSIDGEKLWRVIEKRVKESEDEED